MNGGPKIAEKLVKTWRNAKKRCYLEASRRLFGGPCDHHRQALSVAYECVRANLSKYLFGPLHNWGRHQFFYKSGDNFNHLGNLLSSNVFVCVYPIEQILFIAMEFLLMKICRNSTEFIKKIAKMAFKPTTSCVRGRNASTVPQRQR